MKRVYLGRHQEKPTIASHGVLCIIAAAVQRVCRNAALCVCVHLCVCACATGKLKNIFIRALVKAMLPEN